MHKKLINSANISSDKNFFSFSLSLWQSLQVFSQGSKNPGLHHKRSVGCVDMTLELNPMRASTNIREFSLNSSRLTSKCLTRPNKVWTCLVALVLSIRGVKIHEDLFVKTDNSIPYQMMVDNSREKIEKVLSHLPYKYWNRGWP